MYSLQKNKKITLIIYTYMHTSQLYQFYTYKYIYLKYSMNILCTSNHICFCRRVVLYVLFMYIYICVHGRSFLNFRFVIFQQRIPEKGHRRSPRSYRRRILYCIRVVVVEVRKNIHPRARVNSNGGNRFAILFIVQHKQTII